MSCLVLDTCVLLWLAAEPLRLSTRVRDRLLDERNELAVSAISAWEIAIKTARGKLELPREPSVWWQAALARYRLREVPVTAAIAMAAVAEALPHNDPADRIVVATARLLNAQLLTRDQVLLSAVPFSVW
ncbi:MAG: type II toxin-antitoxin system VapC family toxin [Polyangiaceae bacterium]|nr:type II toxin-antitoxin system VapC family toxin [Polyangiaceae bacterium]